MSSHEMQEMGDAGGGGEAVRIVKTSDKGRGLMTNIAIPSNSVVYEEKPLIYSVNDVSEFKNCNWCLKQISEMPEPHRACSECKLAVFCCPECRKNSKHEILECRVFQNMAEDEAFGRPNTQVGYATRMLLRIITELGITNSESLREFCQLCTNASSIAHSDWAAHYRRRCELIARHIRDLKELGYSTLVLDEITNSEAGGTLEEVLFNIMCRIHCNAFGVKNNEGQDCGNAIFLQSAALNHSCAPNCVITPKVEGITVRSIRDLAPNTEVTINYSVVDNPDQRRQYLAENYFFDCMCDVCVNRQDWREAQEKGMAEAMDVSRDVGGFAQPKQDPLQHPQPQAFAEAS